MKNGAVFSRLRHDAVFCVIFKVGFIPELRLSRVESSESVQVAHI